VLCRTWRSTNNAPKKKQGSPYPGMGKVWSTPIEFLGKRRVTDSNVPARCGGSWPLVAAPPLLSLRGAAFAAQRTPGLTVQTVRRSAAPCTVRGLGRPQAAVWVGCGWFFACLSVCRGVAASTRTQPLCPIRPPPPPPPPPRMRSPLRCIDSHARAGLAEPGWDCGRDQKVHKCGGVTCSVGWETS
jgi:hypothetical protein